MHEENDKSIYYHIYIQLQTTVLSTWLCYLMYDLIFDVINFNNVIVSLFNMDNENFN